MYSDCIQTYLQVCTMLPKGNIVSKITVLASHSYILSMHVEDNQEVISVVMTDYDNFFFAQIKEEEISNVAKKLATDKLKIINILKISVQENKLEYKEEECKLLVTLWEDTKMHTLHLELRKTDIEEKNKYLKSLLFRLANQLSQQEKVPTNTQAQAVCSAAGNVTHSIPPTGYPGKIFTSVPPSVKPTKRRCAGMSIINPTFKRIHSRPGIQFDEG